MNNFLVDDGKRIACKIVSIAKFTFLLNLISILLQQARKKEHVGSDRQTQEDKSFGTAVSEILPVDSSFSASESESLIADDPFNPVSSPREYKLPRDEEVLQTSPHVSNYSPDSVAVKINTKPKSIPSPDSSADIDNAISDLNDKSIPETTDAEDIHAVSSLPAMSKRKGRPRKPAVTDEDLSIAFDIQAAQADLGADNILLSKEMEVATVDDENSNPKERKKGRPKEIQVQ